MPLTPADVHHVSFGRAAIGKRGYDEDEVDKFLEVVEAELTRLFEQNNRLHDELTQLRGGNGGGNQARAAQPSELRARLEQLAREKDAAQVGVDQLRGELEQARTEAAADGEQQALGLLFRAQRSVEEHLADARREADNLLTGARHTAENSTSQARANAQALDREVRTRYQQALGPLEERLAELESHIGQLQNFERENRTRLRSYLHDQIRHLDSTRPDAAGGNRVPVAELPAPGAPEDVNG